MAINTAPNVLGENSIGRIDWIDGLKFLGLLAIYIGHFGTNTGRLYPYVWIYHVPLMFICSGFFSHMKKVEVIIINSIVDRAGLKEKQCDLPKILN